MRQEEELHDQLLKKFREYFEANQKWLGTGTKRSAIELRRIMSEIRKICSERRIVVREWMDWKEAELLERNIKRKGQNSTDGEE
jgi:uncharacterized protein YggL (DUF469 family)